MRKIFGALILLTVFGLLFAILIISAGFYNALIILAIVAVLGAMWEFGTRLYYGK